MNYYPYMGYYPYLAQAPRTGLFRSLFRGGTLSSIINGTQKTLGVINQAIPVIKQVKPIVNNAKTMFKVMNEFKKTDAPKTRSTNKVTKDEKKKNVENSEPIVSNHVSADGPTFFV